MAKNDKRNLANDVDHVVNEMQGRVRDMVNASDDFMDDLSYIVSAYNGLRSAVDKCFRTLETPVKQPLRTF